VTRPPGRARAAVLALAVLSALAVAGCTGARVPSAPDPGGVHTAVTPRQAVAVLSTVDATVVRAVQARDAGQFGARVVGPAREALTSTVAVQSALKQTPSVPPSPSTPRLMLPLAGPWPRWFLAAGSSPASATPLLDVLSSADARTPYGLWAQLQLLPGAVLPEVASATVGSAVLGPGAPGLASTPADTIAHYTDLLNRGDASAYLGQFSVDVYRQQLTTQLGVDRRNFMGGGVGGVIAQHAVPPGAPFAMATLDGGALVIGRVDQTYTATVTPGKGSARLDPQLAALAGRPTISKSLVRHSVEVLAFHVPPAGTADKITLLAAGRWDVSATGS
jgi:hypothetical protein